jgi:putative endonuclease
MTTSAKPLPKTAKQALGQRGEAMAQAHLQHKGYHIITTNWRCKEGEIDIVAHKDDAWAFVEVRTRRAPDTSFAFESITPAKRRKMIAVSHAYRAAHGLEEAFTSIDVIGIALPRGHAPIVEHVIDALDW